MNNELDEFVRLLEKKMPGVHIVEFKTRSLETIKGVILTITEAGLLDALLTVLTFWIDKHKSNTIKISYKTADEKLIEVTYSSLNKAETEKILLQNPPRINSTTKLILP